MRAGVANILTILLILGTLLAAAVGVLKYRSLSEDVSAKRAEIELLDAEIAERGSGDAYLVDAHYYTEDLLTDLARICSPQPRPDMAQFCREQYSHVLLAQAFDAAALTRVSRSSNIEAAYRHYADLVRGISDENLRNASLARALEGVGYAQFRRGDFESAQETINEATRLDPSAVAVGATALKLSCQRGEQPSAVQVALANLRQRLDGQIRQAGSNSDRRFARNAQLERNLLEGDAELFHACRYAAIERRPLIPME